MVRASVLAAVPLVALLSLATLSPAQHGRQVIVAVGPGGAVAAAPDGSGRVELPWLLPGDRDPAVSPDGRRVAFSSRRHGNAELYVADAVSGRVRRLTLNARAVDRRPEWSPDGRRLAWQSGREGAFDLFVMNADGRRKRALVAGAGDDVDPAWSPDGARVAFASSRSGRYALWAVNAAGGEPELLLDAGEALALRRGALTAGASPTRVSRVETSTSGRSGWRRSSRAGSRTIAPPTSGRTGRPTAVTSRSPGRRAAGARSGWFGPPEALPVRWPA